MLHPLRFLWAMLCSGCWLPGEALLALPPGMAAFPGIVNSGRLLALRFRFLTRVLPRIELWDLGRSRFYAASLHLTHSCVCVIIKQFLSYLNCAPLADPAHLPAALVISVLINLSKKQIKLIASQAEFWYMYLSAASRCD